MNLQQINKDIIEILNNHIKKINIRINQLYKYSIQKLKRYKNFQYFLFFVYIKISEKIL